MLINKQDLAAARHFARRIVSMVPEAITVDAANAEIDFACELHEATDREIVAQLGEWLAFELFAAREKDGGNLAEAINELAAIVRQK